MIRSPISAEERLRNRVETLEGHVKELQDTLMKSFEVLRTLLCGTDKRVDELDDTIGSICQDLDYHETHIDNLIAATGIS